MITAPTNNNTAPVAASGARTGAMPSAARKDQAHGAQELKDSDDPEGTLAEVSDPFRGGAAHTGQLLLGHEHLRAAGDEEDNGQDSGDDPQSEV